MTARPLPDDAKVVDIGTVKADRAQALSVGLTIESSEFAVNEAGAPLPPPIIERIDEPRPVSEDGVVAAPPRGGGMKAISLWQPWATAVALNSKRVETRYWATAHRGPIAIHAAKRRVGYELLGYESSWSWRGALGLVGGAQANLYDTLPFGAIVAVAMLVDCKPTGMFTNGALDWPRRPKGEGTAIYDWTERQMGDFSLGRFGWVLENIYKLPEPIAFVGRQALFNVPDNLLPAHFRAA